ncbi:MAG: metallophosphoesterase [Kiritimatiellia bacterium]|jgi:hypothetical protein
MNTREAVDLLIVSAIMGLCMPSLAAPPRAAIPGALAIGSGGGASPAAFETAHGVEHVAATWAAPRACATHKPQATPRLDLPFVDSTSSLATTPFTVAVIPDAQHEATDNRMRHRLQWLIDNRTNLNLKMVLAVGDVMNFNNEAQYINQSQAFHVLNEAGIPYAIALGNHDTAAVKEDGGDAAPGDVNLNLRNTQRFNTHFPLDRFSALAGIGEHGKIDNSYHAFSAGGTEWLVLCLELFARTDAVDWAKGVVASHPNHNVIVVTHAHLTSSATVQQDNGGYGDNSPQYVFDQLKQFKNVRIVLSGHTGVHGYRSDYGPQGNLIHQFLQTYHDRTHNPVRLLKIDLQADTIESEVFVPSSNSVKQDGSAFTKSFSTK